MEDYVTFEQATKLKELGFDWKTWIYYDEDDNELTESISSVDWNGETDSISVPTLAQASKWLREKGITILLYILQEQKMEFFIGKSTTKKDFGLKALKIIMTPTNKHFRQELMQH